MARIKTIATALLCCVLVSAVGAQSLESIDIQRLDFSDARLSFAGPSAFFLRNVGYDDGSLGFVFRQVDEVWRITEIVTPEGSALPSDLVLDFARVDLTDQGTLRVDGILLAGEPYSTEITINPDTTLGIPNFLTTGNLIGASLSRALSDAGLVPAAAVESVELERDQAMAQLSRIGETVARLESENEALTDRLTDAEGATDAALAERERLRVDLSQAQEDLATLEERNEVLVQELEAARSAAAANGGTSDADANGVSEAAESAARIAELQRRIQELEAEVLEQQDQIAELESAAQALENSAGGDASNTAGPDIDADVADLVRTIDELERVNAVLTQERNNIEAELRHTLAWDGYLALVRRDFQESRLTGFAGSSSAMGTWQSSAGTVAQTDPSQYFARLDLPLVQNREALLYEFTGTATGRGWAGYGMHIYADKSTLRRGYGFGESLLVWLTRDPEVYGTNQTYLELYRSKDDVNMERVLHAAIEEPISAPLKIEILYQPEQEYITIAVNGEEKIRYKTWFEVDNGVQVALRSLGTAQFTGLRVLAE